MVALQTNHPENSPSCASRLPSCVTNAAFTVKTELYAQPPPSFCPERALPVVEDLRSRVVFWVFAIWLTLYVFMTSVFSRWSSLALRMQSYTVYQYANLLMLWVVSLHAI